MKNMVNEVKKILGGKSVRDVVLEAMGDDDPNDSLNAGGGADDVDTNPDSTAGPDSEAIIDNARNQDDWKNAVSNNSWIGPEDLVSFVKGLLGDDWDGYSDEDKIALTSDMFDAYNNDVADAEDEDEDNGDEELDNDEDDISGGDDGGTSATPPPAAENQPTTGESTRSYKRESVNRISKNWR